MNFIAAAITLLCETNEVHDEFDWKILNMKDKHFAELECFLASLEPHDFWNFVIGNGVYHDEGMHVLTEKEVAELYTQLLQIYNTEI